MAVPEPFPGLVVRYAFLWSHEAARGQENGRKDRPCVVILARERQEDGRHLVTVAPITHRSTGQMRAIEVPAAVKRHLGLDDDASWIVLDDLNRFVWPGPDLRPIERRRPGVFAFGVLPVDVFRQVKRLAADLLQQRRATAHLT